IVKLLLQTADLRLVLLLDLSDRILELFDLVIRGRLRRGRYRQSGARQTGDQPADRPLSIDVSLPRHYVPREMRVVMETLTGHYDIVVKVVNEPSPLLKNRRTVCAWPINCGRGGSSYRWRAARRSRRCRGR